MIEGTILCAALLLFAPVYNVARRIRLSQAFELLLAA
jgi:hypothetical protein